jgi:hypothetical protein
MMLVAHSSLLGSGVMVNAAGTAAEAHVAGVGNHASLHHRPVDVGVVNDRLIHMNDRSVVGESAAAPFAARKADAAIAEAVVHAAVIADVRPPVAFMEDVMAAFPAPVVGRP